MRVVLDAVSQRTEFGFEKSRVRAMARVRVTESAPIYRESTFLLVCVSD